MEDCDSTWETDSEPELQDPGGEEGPPLEQAGGGEGDDDPAADRQRRQQQPPPPPEEEPLPATGGRPEAAENREGAAVEEEKEEVEKEKAGGDGVAEEDEAEGREQGETEAPGPEQVTQDPCKLLPRVGGRRGALELFLVASWMGPLALTLESAGVSPRLAVASLCGLATDGGARKPRLQGSPWDFWLLFSRTLAFLLRCLPPQPWKYLHAL